MPELEPLLELDQPKMWFGVPECTADSATSWSRPGYRRSWWLKVGAGSPTGQGSGTRLRAKVAGWSRKASYNCRLAAIAEQSASSQGGRTEKACYGHAPLAFRPDLLGEIADHSSVRDRGVGGSNPLAPTKKASVARKILEFRRAPQKVPSFRLVGSDPSRPSRPAPSLQARSRSRPPRHPLRPDRRPRPRTLRPTRSSALRPPARSSWSPVGLGSPVPSVFGSHLASDARASDASDRLMNWSIRRFRRGPCVGHSSR